MVWYNFCENIHKFQNSFKKIRLIPSLYRIRTRTTFSQCDPKKMKHIKSPEKKISTKVLFMTLYHTATDNSQSNQHQLSKIRKIWQCYKYILTPNKLVLNLRVITVTWRCYHHQRNVTVLCQRSNQAPQMSTYV